MIICDNGLCVCRDASPCQHPASYFGADDSCDGSHLPLRLKLNYSQHEMSVPHAGFNCSTMTIFGPGLEKTTHSTPVDSAATPTALSASMTDASLAPSISRSSAPDRATHGQIHPSQLRTCGSKFVCAFSLRDGVQKTASNFTAKTAATAEN